MSYIHHIFDFIIFPFYAQYFQRFIYIFSKTYNSHLVILYISHNSFSKKGNEISPTPFVISYLFTIPLHLHPLISTSYIRGITSGRSLPSMSEFLYICEYLGITPSEFFKEEKETTLTQQKAIDYIYTMTDEDIQLLIGFIERMKHTDE